jgi:hypothetical protein
MLMAGAVAVFLGAILVALPGMLPGFGPLQTRERATAGALKPRGRACAATHPVTRQTPENVG